MIAVRCQLMILIICLVSNSPTAYGLSIALDAAKSEYTLTEGIEFRLSFFNNGDTSIFLARPRSYGTGTNALRIIAKRQGCQYEVVSTHFDTRIEDLKFFFVPLLQEDTLSQSLPVLSDASSIGGLELLLPGPGTYSFSAEFTSEGASYEAYLGPVWRGAVKSNAVELHLVAPGPAEIEHWRSQLRDCVRSSSCMAHPAVRYFSYVKDERAARLLIKALRVEPNDTFSAEALYRQAIPEAAGFLRAMSNTPSLDTEIREHYLSLADSLENASAHECPEVLSLDW